MSKERLPDVHELRLGEPYLWVVAWTGTTYAPDPADFRARLEAVGLSPVTAYDDAARQAGFLRPERHGVTVADFKRVARSTGATGAAITLDDSLVPDVAIWANEVLQDVIDVPRDARQWWDEWRPAVLAALAVLVLGIIAILVLIARKP